jgi:dynactin-6
MSDQVLISKNIDYEGQIGFGHGTILHPDCSIRAESASIVLGEYNIIEERVRILNRKPEENPSPAPMVIGNYNLFEVGASIDYCEIGNFNTFEHRARVEANCKIGNFCIVTAGVTVPAGSIIPDGTIVFGQGRTQKNLNMQEEVYKANIRSLADVLMKALHPNSMQSSK